MNNRNRLNRALQYYAATGPLRTLLDATMQEHNAVNTQRMDDADALVSLTRTWETHTADFEAEILQAQRNLVLVGYYKRRTPTDTVKGAASVTIDGAIHTPLIRGADGLKIWLEATDSMMTAETPKTTERLLQDAYSRMVGGMFWLVATTKEAQDLKEKTKLTIREIETHFDMPDADRWYDPSDTEGTPLK